MKRRTTKLLDYVGLIMSYLSKGGGTREGLDGYPYLNNLFQL